MSSNQEIINQIKNLRKEIKSLKDRIEFLELSKGSHYPQVIPLHIEPFIAPQKYPWEFPNGPIIYC